ncbi:MAG TPA: cation transporter [Acidimicrobiia bacterium]|nr:cation transporter [Acidimicrobiia bacterium]
MPPTDTIAALQTRALRLEYATIAWNVGEAFLTIALGAVAGSVALIGFGTVSVVEVFASSVVVWHLRKTRDGDVANVTGLALRLIAMAFAVLAIAVFAVALRDLTSGRRAGGSPFGIGYLAITAMVMFGLAVAKRRVASGLRSEPLASEATVTFLDGVLSVSTLAGLALNAYLGWWWADPVAGMVVAVFALNEGRESLAEAGAMSASQVGPHLDDDR